jgi:hypothetical protein
LIIRHIGHERHHVALFGPAFTTIAFNAEFTPIKSGQDSCAAYVPYGLNSG